MDGVQTVNDYQWRGVLAAVEFNILVFWIVFACGLARKHERSGGVYCLYFKAPRTRLHDVSTHKMKIRRFNLFLRNKSKNVRRGASGTGTMLRAYVGKVALMFHSHLNVLTSVTLQTLYLRQQLGRMIYLSEIVLNVMAARSYTEWPRSQTRSVSPYVASNATGWSLVS